MLQRDGSAQLPGGPRVPEADPESAGVRRHAPGARRQQVRPADAAQSDHGGGKVVGPPVRMSVLRNFRRFAHLRGRRFPHVGPRNQGERTRETGAAYQRAEAPSTQQMVAIAEHFRARVQAQKTLGLQFVEPSRPTEIFRYECCVYSVQLLLFLLPVMCKRRLMRRHGRN